MPLKYEQTEKFKRWSITSHDIDLSAASEASGRIAQRNNPCLEAAHHAYDRAIPKHGSGSPRMLIAVLAREDSLAEVSVDQCRDDYS